MTQTMAGYLEERGEARGKTGGLREALETVLTKRFGPVAPEVARALGTADVETLRVWLDVALTADSLHEVGIPSIS